MTTDSIWLGVIFHFYYLAMATRLPIPLLGPSWAMAMGQLQLESALIYGLRWSDGQKADSRQPGALEGPSGSKTDSSSLSHQDGH